MDNDSILLRALNEAIWLCKNSERIERETLFRVVEDIGEYGIFSARQVASMTNGRISHQTAAKLCAKSDRTGGKLNVQSLEDIRECLYSRIRGRTDYDVVRKVISNGTSQGMLAKLSGINQARISRNVRE
jgi:hypothetical protein